MLDGESSRCRIMTAPGAWNRGWRVAAGQNAVSAVRTWWSCSGTCSCLDTDLLALDDKLGLEPINYLVGRQERERCDVVVLSMVDTGPTKLSSLELVLGGATSGIFAPAKFPAAPRPDHDVNAAAEHRLNLTMRHLTAIGCQASGLISD